MAAVFAGIVRAPMTSVLMIFEMTPDYAVIVPPMISNLVSFVRFFTGSAAAHLGGAGGSEAESRAPVFAWSTFRALSILRSFPC